MLGGGVNIIFGVEVIDSRFHLVEGNNISYLIPVRNREKIKKFESVSVGGVVILEDVFGRMVSGHFRYGGDSLMLIVEPRFPFHNRDELLRVSSENQASD